MTKIWKIRIALVCLLLLLIFVYLNEIFIIRKFFIPDTLLVIAETHSSSASFSSQASSKIIRWNVLEPERNLMPKKRVFGNDFLYTVDQSSSGSLNAKQRISLGNFMRPFVEYYSNLYFDNKVRSLPDDNILVVGRVVDYLAPSWILLFSKTGSLLEDFTYKIPRNENPEFKGFYDGFLFYNSSFGDGGGWSSHANAIDIRTGSATVLSSWDAMYHGDVENDVNFLPSVCTIAARNSDLESIARNIALEQNINENKIYIGKICTTDNATIVPFSIPENSIYGVSIKLANKDPISFTKVEKDFQVFPPLYSKDTNGYITLSHSFETKTDTEYRFMKKFIDISIYENDSNISEGELESIENLSFCLKHYCIK